MQNQNLFALLLDDADDVSFVLPSSNDAVDPKKGSAGQKKKPSNQSSDDSDPRSKRLNRPRPVNRKDAVINKSKSELQGQEGSKNIAYQQRSVASNNYRSSNVGSNGGGANGNYKGNSFQRNYNNPNPNQDSYGRGYGGRGRGRNNSGEQRFNEYSNGAVNYNQSLTRRGNGRGNQSHPSTESEGLKFENNKVPNSSQKEVKDSVGDDSEGWQVVSRRKQGSVANSEVRSEVSYNSEAKDDQSDGFGWRNNGVVDGQTGHYRRGNGTYWEQGGKGDPENTMSVASNNSGIKDDNGDAGNGDASNANSVGGEISVEDEERRMRREKWLKEKEEDEKKMTLKQYEERMENQKTLALREPRIVALDKELEAMHPLGKKKESIAVTDVNSDKNKEKKKVTTGPKDNVCKTIVELFMKPASFQRRGGYNNRRSDEGPYHNGNSKGNVGDASFRKGNDAKGTFDKGNVGEASYWKGNVAKGFSDKGDAVEGSYRKGPAPTDKGNTFERNLPKDKVIEMKNGNSKGGKSEAVSIKFDDDAQFPALK